MSDKDDIDCSLSTALLRGVRRLCPRCGKGNLLERYLRTVECCSVCGEPFGHLPADDMPPWMTILLVGLIITPTMVFVNRQYEMETYAQLALWIPLALILTLFLLPCCKGFILALLWTQRSSKDSVGSQSENSNAEEDEKDDAGKAAIEYIGRFDRYKIVAGHKDGQYHARAYAGRHEVKGFTGSTLEETVRKLKDFLQDRMDTFRKSRDAGGIPGTEEYLEAFQVIRDQIPKNQLRLLVFYARNRDTQRWSQKIGHVAKVEF